MFGIFFSNHLDLRRSLTDVSTSIMDFKDILCAKIFLQVNADEYSDEDSCRTAVLANSY